MCPPWERKTNNIVPLVNNSSSWLIVTQQLFKTWSMSLIFWRLLAAEEHPELSNLWDSDQVGEIASLAAEWSREQQSLFTCQRWHIYKRVTTLVTCIQFQLFIKEYLTHWQTFCIDWQTVIFAEHFGANRLILRRTVVKWWCINLCAFFSGPLCIGSWWRKGWTTRSVYCIKQSAICFARQCPLTKLKTLDDAAETLSFPTPPVDVVTFLRFHKYRAWLTYLIT